MIIYVWKYQNDSFSRIGIIDNAKSVIWVKRYNTTGEFEIYIRASSELLQLFQGDIFLTRDDSTVTMYAEKIQLNTDDENGNYLIISGRSAECILGLRVVKQAVFTATTTTAETILRSVVGDFTPAGTNPGVGERRKFPFLSLGEQQGWQDLLTRQFTGKNLLELVSELCNEYNYGFELTFTGTGFVFNLYKGTDRSFAQNENTFVVFSPEFENLGNTEYTNDKTNFANAAFVAGEGEGAARKIFYWYTRDTSALGIREIWVDARNTSSNTEAGQLTPEEYRLMLKAQGWEAVMQHKVLTTFNGAILNYNAYTYGVDYNLGDKVSIKNEYGITGNANITEITEVEDESGYNLIPTLSEWEVAETED